MPTELKFDYVVIHDLVAARHRSSRLVATTGSRSCGRRQGSTPAYMHNFSFACFEELHAPSGAMVEGREEVKSEESWSRNHARSVPAPHRYAHHLAAHSRPPARTLADLSKFYLTRLNNRLHRH